MRLHEAYFGNMAKLDPRRLDPDSDFGRTDRPILWVPGGLEEGFRRRFQHEGASAGRLPGLGPGEGSNLFNIWINEHDTGHLFYCVSLLVSDVFEHAYIADYGTSRKDYIEAFMKVVDWAEVQKRFTGVVKLTISHAY